MTIAAAAHAELEATSLDELTGIRSGKRSYYPAYVRSNERLHDTVRALDRISAAVVRTHEGPRTLVEAVLQAAADHLQADWVMFALADEAMPAARPRFLMLGGAGWVEHEAELPPEARAELRLLQNRPGDAGGCRAPGRVVRVSMTLEGEPIGGLAALPSDEVDIADTDVSILHVLANQAAVALHNSSLFHTATLLKGRTQQLTVEADRQAANLRTRSTELQEAQRNLVGLLNHQALDEERHRIARELHDSVTQDVWSAGMAIELCRTDLAEIDGVPAPLIERLTAAKDLTRHAVERLRVAIYALNTDPGEEPASLPALLGRLSTVHLPSDLRISVSVRGEPRQLDGELERALLRIAGEALFNTARHSDATQAAIRLRYGADSVSLTVSDDGDGKPACLRKLLRLSQAADLGGQHRGLVNMAARAREFGGSLSIGSSPMGGIKLRVVVPLGGTDPSVPAQ
ncbi:MadS family sensor histidine kinase [Candidatus Mycolicibacterium alkanivorans]|uniref:histidine kinase n=1 Tax=Candidatus Mycolicibacterium alkanivorans TaxID=2954114 RepID=A0ABS9YYL9_9MYCO|nr:histidine kinase [Candidatus Mycolicibacterium alkanivorans]MCI4676362.1 histidine kinase [Candidatus Mycolicibacterium alkanivorans]